MTVFATLKLRWRKEFDARPLSKAIRPAFHNLLDASEMLQQQQVAIARDGRLTAAGQVEQVRKFAGTPDIAQRIAKCERTIAQGKAKLQERRRSLLPRVKDPSNVSEALLRREFRDFLCERSVADRLKIVFDPEAHPTLIDAVFESPRLAGIAPEVMQALTDAIVARTSGPEAAAIEQDAAAIELAETAVEVARKTLREAVALPESEFAAWHAKAAPVDSKQQEAESAKFTADLVAKDAAALPFTARTSLIESLLKTNSDELTGRPKDEAA